MREIIDCEIEIANFRGNINDVVFEITDRVKRFETTIEFWKRHRLEILNGKGRVTQFVSLDTVEWSDFIDLITNYFSENPVTGEETCYFFWVAPTTQELIGKIKSLEKENKTLKDVLHSVSKSIIDTFRS